MPPDQAVAHLARARELVVESVRLYTLGHVDEAYVSARNAYLDHFEFVEVAIRLVDFKLMLDVEGDFVRLRIGIRELTPLPEVEKIAVDLMQGFDRIERRLSSPGLAASGVAAISGFAILFREGLEAVLIIGAVLSLRARGNQGQLRWLLGGAAGGVIASAALFAAVVALWGIAPFERPMIEAVIAVLAIVLAAYVAFRLLLRTGPGHRLQLVPGSVRRATARGSAVAFFAVGFLCALLVGMEAALFYRALLPSADRVEVYMAFGALMAAALLAVVGYLILAGRLPPKWPVRIATVLFMAVSIAFIGNAVRSLQAIDLIPTTVLAVPPLPAYLSPLLGWHPTVQTVLAQGALATAFVIGCLYLAVVGWRRSAKPQGTHPEIAGSSDASAT